VLGDPVNFIDPKGLYGEDFNQECHELCLETEEEYCPSDRAGRWGYYQCYSQCVQRKKLDEDNYEIDIEELPWWVIVLPVVPIVEPILAP